MKFSYGGQAVIEGVLMRGAKTYAIAARDPEGRIVIHEKPLSKRIYGGWISKTPFVRGVVGLWDALGLGTRALTWSADVQMGEEEQSTSFSGPIGFLTIAFALIIGIGFFFLLPTTAATGIGGLLGLTEGEAGYTSVGFNAFLINVIEGVIQLMILIGYIWLIGRLPDVKRLFGYHGAEHKTINAYEAGDELTPEIVAQYPIEHPRCGTAFLLTVVFVSIFVFSLLGRPPFIWLVISRVLLIPVIAGIAYELLKWTANNIDKPLVRLMVTPNLALQHLTTRQPDLDMIEVAITSFKRVLLSEGLISEDEARVPEELKPQDTTFARDYQKEKAKREAKKQAEAQAEAELVK
ncbi:MAG: DUF1385 domain-containing protein [Phototrophicales bacterium]|nr:MAG: DUF1385 domain-containing protein [Phototrophicales bacterium]